MPGLGQNDPIVLVMIVGATSTIWAIGFTAYAFIFNYLHHWVSGKEERGTLHPLKASDKKSLEDNKCVFIGFIAHGTLSFATILTAGAAFYTNDSAWVPLAGGSFVVTVSAFFLLFVNEIRSSIRFVNDKLHPPQT